jgi:general secretion pathway protein G
MKEQNMRRRSFKRGFTLLEILVVIAILGLLTAAVGVAIVPTFNKAKVDTARNNDIPNIMNGLKTYYLQKGKYPDTGTGLKALVDAQILDKVPLDPWKNPYVYMLEANKPVVISYGDDGVPGGSDFGTDISSKDDPNAVKK